MGHTPGSWRVSAIGRRNDGSLAVMSEFGPVAYANLLTRAPRGKAYLVTDDESESNACLIAAAPDMLNALKTIEALICEKELCGHFTPEEIRAVTSAAIAKAEAKS